MTKTLDIDGYEVKPLTIDTWPDFEALAGRHNGVFGGCWCAYFHCHTDRENLQRELGNQQFKKRMLEDGIAHAALLYDDGEAIAWAEYGTVDELPNIHHRKQWEAELDQRPDYRITCLFVDRRYRRNGFAERAVRAALALIAAQGGGRVEAYPHDLDPDRKISSSFLYNATRTMYERLGFSYERPKGKGNCTMSLHVPAV